MSCVAFDGTYLYMGEAWGSRITKMKPTIGYAPATGDRYTDAAGNPYTDAAGNNGAASVQNLAMGFTCSGSANLRFLVKVKNAYQGVSGEVLTVRLKIMHID